MKLRLVLLFLATAISVFHDFTQVHGYPLLRLLQNPLSEGVIRFAVQESGIPPGDFWAVNEVNSARGIAAQILAGVERVLKGEVTGPIKAAIDVSVGYCKHIANATLSAVSKPGEQTTLKLM
jgi:hypothetical protein